MPPSKQIDPIGNYIWWKTFWWGFGLSPFMSRTNRVFLLEIQIPIWTQEYYDKHPQEAR